MSEHRVTVVWSRGSRPFRYEAYSRDHVWKFENGDEVAASAAPDFLGSPERIDPEEAYVASLSSCHMLTFLAVAARRRLVVESYSDAAVGTLGKNEAGQLAVTRVVLRPQVVFRGSPGPAAEEVEKLHERAHRGCFIANSVRTSIEIEASHTAAAEEIP